MEIRVRSRGFTLVEVIVASAIMALVFAGLIGGVKLMLDLIGDSKAETGARSLAVSRLEYIRSLDYEDIGTVSGVPSGSIPQLSTTTLNGIEYTERVLVLYIDRPEDGAEENDENGVLEDSKRVKVEYSWIARGEARSLSLMTDIVPKGMETSSGGGTLIVKVFDADVLPVANATVRVTNSSASSSIDITLQTNSEGRAIIPGAPALGGYNIAVTKPGYSSASTYPSTASNPNPNPPLVAVASSTISTVPFFIDELAELTLRSVGEPVTHEVVDEMDDATDLTGVAGAMVAGGQLTLADLGEGGGYAGSGEAYSATIAPAAFSAWESFSWQGNAPTGTDVRVHLYVEAAGVYTLVPDSALPGNSAGFGPGIIDMSTIPADTYPSLALKAELSTANNAVTPVVDSWSVTYVESEPVIPNISFHLSGTKSIGADVLKYDQVVSTDTDGETDLSLEWDAYSLSINDTDYDIKEIKGGTLPFNLLPGVTTDLSIVLAEHTVRSLHVIVTDESGSPLPAATVELSAPGYDEVVETSLYGQTFFADVPAAASFTIMIEHEGFGTYSDSLLISGNKTLGVSLLSN